MYAKNWVGQAPFENFDILVKVKVPLGQRFFFFFKKFFLAGDSDQVRFPGRSRSNRGSGGWRHPWRHSTRRVCQCMACDNTWMGKKRRRVWVRESWWRHVFHWGSVCQSFKRRVAVFLGLKFSGFENRGTLDRVAVSVHWIGDPIYIEVKEETTTFEAYGGA